jgi:hypothetical protein
MGELWDASYNAQETPATKIYLAQHISTAEEEEL